MIDVIQRKKIGELNLKDPFFQSLREDYIGFDSWLNKKSNEDAYVLLENDKLKAFLFLKDEYEEDNNISPVFEKQRRLKVGTFKIDGHGTVLGQRFIGIILRKMIEEGFDTTYVTVFEKQEKLIKLLEKFGFLLWGKKSNNESVYVKKLNQSGDMYRDFPRVEKRYNKKYLLSILPEFHTKMFPNSMLKTERDHKIEDLSFTNTIEKIYVSAMSGIRSINEGDLLVIYRTAERGVSAEYTAVATSVCTVVDVKNIDDFKSEEEYFEFCGKGSVFKEEELKSFFETKKYPFIIKMLYNFPLEKRIIRHDLINDINLDRGAYFGFLELSDNQFDKILEVGGTSEDFIID